MRKVKLGNGESNATRTKPSEVGQRVCNGGKKDGKTVHHGYFCVLQRWQNYPNIALLPGVIVGFLRLGSAPKGQTATREPERYF